MSFVIVSIVVSLLCFAGAVWMMGTDLLFPSTGPFNPMPIAVFIVSCIPGLVIGYQYAFVGIPAGYDNQVAAEEAAHYAKYGKAASTNYAPGAVSDANEGPYVR